MRWRPILIGLFGLCWGASAIGQYEKGTTGFLLVAPILTAVFSLLAALLWWIDPTRKV